MFLYIWGSTFRYIFREEEAIKLDGLSVAEMKELRDKAEKHTFQAEVDRMMKLIINSLYKNKEVSLVTQALDWSNIITDVIICFYEVHKILWFRTSLESKFIK